MKVYTLSTSLSRDMGSRCARRPELAQAVRTVGR
jgi:hypothetical protein